jgi:dynein heavy chain
VLSKLPVTWDLVALRKEAGDTVSPTKIVLFQEIERFNKLIIKINDSLMNLKRALKGEIGMSNDLDELSMSLFNGFLPNIWRK